MRKNLKKQTAVLIVSAALAAQTSLAGYGAPLTPGDWKQEDGAWRFCDPEQNAYAGWVLTSSGWYYMDPSDGKMVTGWKQINGSRYYFETQQGKTEGKMHTGWYQDEQGKWYFFNNKSGEKTEGTMVTGWKWIDGKCYYFSENEDAGVLYVNTVTPDGFSVNDQGQWVDENGNVKTRSESDFTTIQKSTTTVTRSSGSGGGSSHSSSSSSGNSGSSDNSIAVIPVRMTLARMTPARMTLAKMILARMILEKMTPARMILEKMIPARMTLEKMILEMAETPEKMTPVTQTNQMISQKKQRS